MDETDDAYGGHQAGDPIEQNRRGSKMVIDTFRAHALLLYGYVIEFS